MDEKRIGRGRRAIGKECGGKFRQKCNKNGRKEV